MRRKDIFAIRLKEIRLEIGKTQKEFANMVESTSATISAYENATKNPSLEIVINIAEKCNISIDWLCGLSEEKELKPEINNYKDIAVRVLELLNADIYCYGFYLELFTKFHEAFEDPEQVHVLSLPQEPEFLKFIETYKELYALYNSGKIQQRVIDTWLDGALEELKEIPTQPPIIEYDDDYNFTDEPIEPDT